MEAQRRSRCSRHGVVLLLLQAGAVVRGLTPISSSSSCRGDAATTSPLFRCPSQPVSNLYSNHNKVNVRALQSLGYPLGFCKALVSGAQIYAKRYWIIDDSLSMMTTDGHFLLQSEGPEDDGDNKEMKLEMVPCTRWNELRETCLQHAILAQHLEVPTDFRLLNCPTGHFRIPRATSRGGFLGNSSKKNGGSMSDVQHAQKILSRAKPAGSTPLTARLHLVRNEIESLTGARVTRHSEKTSTKLEPKNIAIVLATDGLPTHEADHGHSTPAAKEEFRQALQALPPDVSVVIRLCTDDVAVVDYYKNELKASLPHVQILDDYWAEAERVHQLNPWLNYGLVLHRVREMGCCGHVPLLKMLSQRSFSTSQVAEFCQFLFDLPASSSCSWDDLCVSVQEANKSESLVWNPVRSQMEPWVDLSKYEFLST